MSKVKEYLWKGLVTLSVILGAVAARKVSEAIWARTAKSEVPKNPAHRSVSWSQAVMWAVLSSVAAGIARVVARRGASEAWQRVTGEQPPMQQAAG